MGGIGKNPHRPEGKADADNQRMQAVAEKEGAPFTASGRSAQKAHDRDRRQMRDLAGGRGELARKDAERAEELDQVGGSRPGVESRVKDAIEEREERERNAD